MENYKNLMEDHDLFPYEYGASGHSVKMFELIKDFIRRESEGSNLDLIRTYLLDRPNNGFPRELSKQLSDNWKFKIFSATLSDSNDVLNTIGKVVVITHGNTTTYLIGYTNNIGRYNNANYLLLWKAIIDAKNEGCQFFDLGGLNQTTTKGVAHFKRGLKGKEYILQGEKLYTNYKIISITFVWMESLYNKLSKQIKKFKGRVLIT